MYLLFMYLKETYKLVRLLIFLFKIADILNIFAFSYCFYMYDVCKRYVAMVLKTFEMFHTILTLLIFQLQCHWLEKVIISTFISLMVEKARPFCGIHLKRSWIRQRGRLLMGVTLKLKEVTP